MGMGLDFFLNLMACDLLANQHRLGLIGCARWSTMTSTIFMFSILQGCNSSFEVKTVETDAPHF